MTQRLLEGKVALVTGAGCGIGREIALSLARDAARVAVHYSQSEGGAAETLASIVAHGGQAFVCRADVADREEVAALFALIDREAGRLDIVVNNAGVSGGGNLPISITRSSRCCSGSICSGRSITPAKQPSGSAQAAKS